MDRLMAYKILYALAARDGREAALFGDCAPLAERAFEHSIPGDAFPELWFELPLMGEPWFDLHALTSVESLDSNTEFTADEVGGHEGAFRWFAAQGKGVRQMALSWDTGSGDMSSPAVQLLLRTSLCDTTCDFLKAAGRPDAAPAYRTFFNRLPKGWFACYTGVFPSRPGHNLRVECIPDSGLQREYITNPQLLESHLKQVGLQDLGETIVPRCCQLADTPFQLEFQFDVMPDGSAGPTFGASLRFGDSSDDDWGSFDPDGAAGELMRQVEAWGLADERWRLLADAAFAKHVKPPKPKAGSADAPDAPAVPAGAVAPAAPDAPAGAAGAAEPAAPDAPDAGSSQSVASSNGGFTLYCIPTFVKLRWRAGDPLDAKAYLIAGVQ